MAPTLTIERVAITALVPHPSNPRQGDIGKISESLSAHGQYRPVVVQRSSGHVLAGNHTVKAAHQLGWTDIDVVYLDCDDDTALRILLTDNAASDAASYDNNALALLLVDLAQQSPAGLVGTGHDGDTLDALLADLAAPLAPFPTGPSDHGTPADATTNTLTCPSCGHQWSDRPPKPGLLARAFRNNGT